MPNIVDEIEGIARLVDALRPWHDTLVFIGGWAHRLYRFHGDARVPSYRAPHTKDVDIAIPAKKLAGNIGSALRAADFTEVLSGDHTPPVSEYRLGGEDGGFYAEFLAPLRGSATKRAGGPDATVTVAGVTAQKLRYLDVLLVAPWNIELRSERGIPVSAPARVLLPNPVSFMVRKLLIQSLRPSDKQAQDTLYIHDTLELFGEHLDTLRSLWLTAVQPTLSPTAVTDVETLILSRFGNMNDVLRSAARVPQDRTLDPLRLRALCRYALGEIFSIRFAKQ